MSNGLLGVVFSLLETPKISMLSENSSSLTTGFFCSIKGLNVLHPLNANKNVIPYS